MAFDCLPHGLLISKLKAYGVCEEACMLIANYFQGRMQRVKISNNKSDWMEISKGCPQGSLFGPLAYNIFSNDLLLSIQNICDIYNYADDNSIGYSANTVAEVTDKLNSVASLMMEWFESNSLQANPNKFQFIIHSPNNALYDSMLSINNNVQLKPVAEVKLLGVTFDSKLTFTKHINNLCIKAGRHINALSRLSNVLSKDSKQQLFQTFILSNFNFCPVVWHFCGMAELKQIEKVQKRALKIIYNDFNNSYVNLRENANRPLMYVDRLRYIVIEIFKIYHGMSPIYLSDLVAKTSQMYNTRNVKSVLIPSFNSATYGYNSFKYQGAKIWNKLPNVIKSACDLKYLNALLMNGMVQLVLAHTVNYVVLTGFNLHSIIVSFCHQFIIVLPCIYIIF